MPHFDHFPRPGEIDPYVDLSIISKPSSITLNSQPNMGYDKNWSHKKCNCELMVNQELRSMREVLENALSGAKKSQPRWKTCVDKTKGLFIHLWDNHHLVLMSGSYLPC